MFREFSCCVFSFVKSPKNISRWEALLLQEATVMPDIPSDFLRDLDQTLQRALDSPPMTSENPQRQGTISPAGSSSSDIGDSKHNSESDHEGIAVGANIAEESSYYIVDILKTDFYEKQNGDLIVRLQPKPLNSNSVSVCFSRDRFDIVFSTKDLKFLTAHEGSNEATRFRWTCQLADLIVPEQCYVRVQSLVEITLRKEDPAKKWTTLCAIQPAERPVFQPTSEAAAPSSPPAIPPRRSIVPIDFPAVQPPEYAKPTCKVPPYNEPGHVAVHGFTGLRNLGNTCFMNAPLQALINTRELRDYFLENYYVQDLNRTNPLGFKGRLAEGFGQFVSEMWSGMNRICEPSLLRDLVGLKASQFANFAQHDAQEFFSFLLDGLHEDLNRVVNKPLTPTVESDGRPDQVVADEAWSYHLMRNDSFIVDLFHGQLKSRLDCPECGHISITFDPFVYLPVPFPKSRRPFTFYYWSTDLYAKPVKYTMSFVEDDGRVADVFARLSAIVNVKPSQFRMIEVFRQKVFKSYNVDDRLARIRANDTIFIFQVYDPEEVGETVTELTIVQRQLYPRMPVSFHCASCGKESQQLRACTKCRTAAYCDVSCQKNDWPAHRPRCRPPSSELVGEPFLISLPSSRLTFGRLVQSLEARARHSVDVFQAPLADPADQSELQPGFPAGVNQSENFPPDSDSESNERTISHNVNGSPAEIDTSDGRPSKRIRVVFGEPHQQPRSNPLFQLAITNEDGEYVCGGKEKRFIATECEAPLNLSSGTCIAMDWMNKKGRNRDYLVVLTKDDIDCVEEPLSERDESDQHTLHLSNLFEHFIETETLNSDDAWYCTRCREHRQAKKKLQLWRLPSILVVQLKRFVYTSNIFRSKIDKRVIYPVRDFDVRPYMSDGAVEDGSTNTTYDLYAVVCHSGTSFFGHYTAFARLPHIDDTTRTDVEWRAFDDTSVTRVQQESHLVDEDAYFLFYKRRGDSAAGFLGRYNPSHQVCQP